MNRKTTLLKVAVAIVGFSVSLSAGAGTIINIDFEPEGSQTYSGQGILGGTVARRLFEYFSIVSNCVVRLGQGRAGEHE